MPFAEPIWAGGHEAAETRSSAQKQPSMLAELLMGRRVAWAFEKQLPGLATQLRRHGKVLGRVARIGADLAEMLASLARRQMVNRQSDVEFWRELGQRAGRRICAGARGRILCGRPRCGPPRRC